MEEAFENIPRLIAWLILILGIIIACFGVIEAFPVGFIIWMVLLALIGDFD